MDFATGLLARVSQSQKAAQEAERQRAASEAEARRAALAAKANAEKEAIRREADRLIDRNTRARRRVPQKRRPAVRPPADRKPRRSSPAAPRPRPRKEAGPPKPLPGMEFVVRREKKREIRVPHPSDYSDLFGDEYLAGIDLKYVNDMKDESARATKEAQEILAERKAKAEKLMKEAQDSQRKSREMERRGIKPKDKHEWRRKAANNDWVAVDVPPNALSPGERLDLVKKATAAESSGGTAADKGAPGKSVKGKNSAAISQREIAERSRALKERILAATGGAPPKQKPASNQSKVADDRSPVKSKRKRSEEVDRSRRSFQSREPKRPRHDDRDRYSSYSRGYNSDEWSDADGSDDDKSDDEDLFGIEALEREEARSARLGALEDKKERQLEQRRKKEKERRRQEFERIRR